MNIYGVTNFNLWNENRGCCVILPTSWTNFFFFSFISALFYIIFGRRKKEFEEEEEKEEEPIQLRQLKSGGTNEREFLRVRDSMLVNVQPQC